jgi:hypothetical protein
VSLRRAAAQLTAYMRLDVRHCGWLGLPIAFRHVRPRARAKRRPDTADGDGHAHAARRVLGAHIARCTAC